MNLTDSIAKDLYMKVVDFQTFEPLSNAYIYYTINGTRALSSTSEKGVSVIPDVVFPVSVEVSYLGFQKEKFDLNLEDVKEKKDAFYFTKKLKKKNYQLSKMVITGQAQAVLSEQSMYKVNTISADEIQKRGAVTLTEVLQFELNQFISNDNILGSSTNIGGISGQNVKILVNGVPISGSETGFTDLNQININNIKRIESVQGPMSVMYGSNALGGVINIITKKAKNTIEGNFNAYTETIGKINVGTDIGMKHKNHNLNISLSRNFFQGWTPADDTLSRWLLWKPKTQYNTDLNYSYKLKKGKIGIYALYYGEVIENKGVPSVSPFRAFALDDYYITNRFRNTLNFDYQLSKTEYFTSQSTFSNYNRRKNKYYKDLVSLEESLIANDADQDTSVFNQIHLRGAMRSTRFKNIDLLVGYESNFEKGVSDRMADASQEMLEFGLFTSAAYTYKRWSVMPSVRANLHSTFNSNIAYGMHLKYADEKDLSVRASFAKGYRSPNLKELYLEFIDNNHMILGNSALQQEEGYHTEVGFNKIWKASNGNWNMEGNFITNQLRNRIAYVALSTQNNSYQYQNIDRFRNALVSTQLGYNNKNFQTSIGLSYTKILESTGFPSISFYEIIGKATYTIPKLDIRCNAFYRYNKNQPIYFVDGSFAWSKPLHISNVTISKQFFNEALMLQVGMKNVFNIQNNLISETVSVLSSPHGGNGNTTLLLPRSGFLNVLYKF